jgi:hypothetical protein
MTRGLAPGTAVQARDAGASGFSDQYAGGNLQVVKKKLTRVAKQSGRVRDVGAFQSRPEFLRDPLYFFVATQSHAE